MGTKRASDLPDDIDELKRLLLEKDRKISDLQKTNELLSEQVQLLRKYRFARSSEKWTTEDKIQLLMFDEAEAEATEDCIEPNPANYTEVKSHPRRKPGRKPLPENLPRNEIKHQLSEEERKCENKSCSDYENCRLLRPVIGKEITEELEFIPAKIQVNKHIRYKYGPVPCDKDYTEETKAIVTADMPARIIPGSIASPSLLSHVIVSKFSDSLPFYRQERIFKRLDIEISRQTMCNWAMNVSAKCEDFIQLLWDKAREGPLLNMDETSLQVLKEPGKSAQSLSYMWVVVGHYEKYKIVLFTYFRNRCHLSAATLLEGYKGSIQTDGYKGYSKAIEVMKKKLWIWHVGCWAHSRRKFHEAYKASKKGGLAVKALDFIRKLYRIEKDLRKEDLTEKEFVKRRRSEVAPVLRTFKGWMQKQQKNVNPESLLGKAISYTLNEYIKLVRYLKYAYLTPDNNEAERAIRPFTVGRKNWLFNVTPRGAYASANLYSLIETAKANNLDPAYYLHFLFSKIPMVKSKDDLEKLLPWNVKEIIPEVSTKHA